MKNGYDCDGVLAEKPPATGKGWRFCTGPERQERKKKLVEHYKTAKHLPLVSRLTKDDIVITARKKDPDVVAATEQWFQDVCGFVPQIHFLVQSRQHNNVVAFKSRVINENDISHYYEDNKAVLRDVKKEMPNVTYYFVNKKGEILPF